MISKITVSSLSKLLYGFDPMSTGCNVNTHMEDEYDAEAEIIVVLLEHCVSFEKALHTAFNVMFTPDCLMGHPDTPKIIAEYEKHIL